MRKRTVYAAPHDQYFVLRPVPSLQTEMEMQDRYFLDAFNRAAVLASGRSAAELPVMRIVDMRRRTGFEFRYGIRPEQNGFTVASDHLLVVIRDMARRSKIDPFPKQNPLSVAMTQCLN